MQNRASQLYAYLFFQHIVTWLLVLGFISWRAFFANGWTALYFASGSVAASALLLLPMVVPVLLGHRGGERRWVRYAIGAACGAIGLLVHLFLISDWVTRTMFGYHINGLVVNLFLTPGGIESMGLQTSNYILIAIAFLLLAGFEWGMVWAVQFCTRGQLLGKWMHRHWRLAMLWPALVLVCVVMVVLCQGIADYKSFAPVLVNVDAYPLFPEVRMRHLLRSCGLKQTRREEAVDLARKMKDSGELKYPLNPIQRGEHIRYNLIWLVAESLRHDMLTPEIMPNAWKLAEQGWRFTQHYSGGNGTRPAMFSMFYSLPANYWDSFLQALRPPLLFDWLHEDGYDFLCQTSAKFSYPEFNQTIFASMREQELREFSKGIPWQRDAENIDHAIEFVRRHDADHPFFLFSFFEGSHASYSFPEEAPLRGNYLQKVNYAVIGPKDKTELMNRYVNAVHQVDVQIGRLLAALAEAPQVAAKTIVIITGDHGEEFYEKGRLGHNSTFVQEQIRPPMVLYVPGKSPAVYENMSHHTDIVTTLAPLLGVTNPPSDYGVGGNWFSPEYKRTQFLCFGWNIAIVATPEHKYLLPLGKKAGFTPNRLTTLDDAPCQDDAFIRNHTPLLMQVQNEMHRFRQ